MTKEIFCDINPQISAFKQQYVKLEKLLLGSDLYNSKAQIYRRAKNQIQQLIQQAENLNQEYCKCIKEILIGAEISQFDPNSLSDILERKLTLHSKYEAFKADFEDKKNEIAAYDNLNMRKI